MSSAIINIKKRQVEERLQLYYSAERAILEGAQSYQIGKRNLTRADLDAVRKVIKDLEGDLAELEALEAGGGRRKCIRVIPRDI